MTYPGSGWRSARSAAVTGSAFLQNSSPAVPSAALPTHIAEAETPVSPLKGVRWSLVYAGFLLYLVVVTSYQLGIADISMAAALIGLLLQRGSLRVPVMMVWFGIFLLWCLAGFVQTDHPRQVWDAIIIMGKLWLVALVAVNALRARPEVRLFTIVFAGSFALYPVRGALYNYFIEHYTLEGRAIWNYIYENPNDLAALCLLQLGIVAALLANEPKGWVRYCATLGVGILPLLIFMTQSRGALIALSVFVVLATYGQRATLRRILGRRAARRAAVAILGLTIAVAVVAPRGAWVRLSGLLKATDTDRLGEVDPEGSARARFNIWKVATGIIRSNPVFGIGLGAYANAHLSATRYGSAEDPYEQQRSTCIQTSASKTQQGQKNQRVVICNELPNSGGYRDTHSTYLNVLAETGLPGFALFAAMFLSVVVPAERTRRRLRRTLPRESLHLLYLELGLLAFFMAGIFGSFADLSFLYIHLALVWAAGEVLRQHGLSMGRTSPQ